MGPGRAPPTVCPALLLTWRVADLLLGRGRPVLRRALHPLTGALAGPVAAALSRQRRPLTRAVVLLALAISFAASTATFNATYAQQAEADAQLTNGADVTVTQAPGTPAPPGPDHRHRGGPRGAGGGTGATPVRLHRHRHQHHPADHRIQPHRGRPHRSHPRRTHLRAHPPPPPVGWSSGWAWPNGDAPSRSPPRWAPPDGTCAA